MRKFSSEGSEGSTPKHKWTRNRLHSATSLSSGSERSASTTPTHTPTHKWTRTNLLCSSEGSTPTQKWTGANVHNSLDNQPSTRTFEEASSTRPCTAVDWKLRALVTRDRLREKSARHQRFQEGPAAGVELLVAQRQAWKASDLLDVTKARPKSAKPPARLYSQEANFQLFLSRQMLAHREYWLTARPSTAQPSAGANSFSRSSSRRVSAKG